MSESAVVPSTPSTYFDRARQRTTELDRLVAEVERLRADRRNNLGRIRSIGLRLRALADEHRIDAPLWIDQNLHVLLWRKLDIQAKRAELILLGTGQSLDALDAEYADILNQGPRVTPYDAALMDLAGEPLASGSPVAAPAPGVGLLTWVGRMLGLCALVSPFALLLRLGHPIAGVALVVIAYRLVSPNWEWLRHIFDEDEPPKPPDPNIICPGFSSYNEILQRSVAQMEASIQRLNQDERTVEEFDRSIADTLYLLETLQRIRVPAAATQLHAAELAFVHAWIGVFQTARTGAPVTQALLGIDDLVARANEERQRFFSKCRGTPVPIPQSE
jgi:hypothetical protein